MGKETPTGGFGWRRRMKWGHSLVRIQPAYPAHLYHCSYRLARTSKLNELLASTCQQATTQNRADTDNAALWGTILSLLIL